MIRLDLPLIGPAARTLEILRVLPTRHASFGVLLHGDPGVGKSHLLDMAALEITGSVHAIEQVNGQSVSVDLVRQWCDQSRYGNLFSTWTVKRIDELDRSSPAAQAELLSMMDYLPKHMAVLATTNNFRALCAVDKGRLQRRFQQYRVEGPTQIEAADYLVKNFGVPKGVGKALAKGAAHGDLLGGVNMGAAVEDAQAWLAANSLSVAA